MGIKNEHDLEMGGMRPIKTEDGGYISSDEDEAEGQVGPKQDIDRLQIVDLTGDEPPLEDPFAPVRLSRVPHKERAIGLTVEEDSPESSDVPEAVSEKRKGKQKAKDVEFTGSSAIPKRPTTYSSSETEENDPPIKQESTEDDHQTRPRTPDPAGAGTGAEIVSPSRDLPVSPESRRRAKARIKATADALDDDLSDFEIPDPPRFQTQAEKDEWDRQHDDLRQIRIEFGRQPPKDAVQPDAGGDTAMAEANAKLEALKVAEDSRNQNVYIFQFPPVLPDLVPISVKPEPGTAEANGEGEAMDVDQAAEKPVEVKDDESKNTQPKLPSGNVGKLRIHKSGKATLDWGGTSLVLGKGADATFLQNVLIASVPDVKPKEGEPAPEDQEPAVGMGMGQIRGKFVFTPNWDEILR
ncbi:DNA-directed RNA polymerase III subunit RPC4 [Pseudocercospora fuligena]|uniref:DNA-directed RNA polymerase III subunit RPC4 n=1 Tax=Pseudocercospora fuligena TaxID=685502 RepID=A0A8H6RRB2_9PEZI|nr:DNA-directed RNA polymerase III subunit RPC4 [Pseudocercospora fuligena]